jgi:hypothetical protein
MTKHHRPWVWCDYLVNHEIPIDHLRELGLRPAMYMLRVISKVSNVFPEY